MDRVHRLGQLNAVTVYRLYCESTIEHKILQLQQKKKAVAGTLVPKRDSVAVAVPAHSNQPGQANDDAEYEDLDIAKFLERISQQ